jgi:hypothetical protein
MTGFGMAALACTAVMLASCGATSPAAPTPSPSPSLTGTIAPTSPPSTPTPTSTPAPPPVGTAVPECCRVDLPTGWTVHGPSDVGLYQASGSDGRLDADFQGVGSAMNCSTEPLSISNELSDPSSQFHLEGKTKLTINGVVVTAWLTAPNDLQTFRGYEYIDADVAIGSGCFDVGGAEYGDASQPNLSTILRIMASIRPPS